MDHVRRIDPAPAGGVTHGQDVSAILKHQPVRSDITIDRGIDGQSKDQSLILPPACLRARLGAERGASSRACEPAFMPASPPLAETRCPQKSVLAEDTLAG